MDAFRFALSALLFMLGSQLVSVARADEGPTKGLLSLSDDFHAYAVEWDSQRMDFFCDQTKYYTFNLSKADEYGTNPFRKPHSLLLNLALVGGKGAIDDSSLPQKYVIDYVRVYQPAEMKTQAAAETAP